MHGASNYKTRYTRDDLIQAGLSPTFADFVLMPSKPRLFRSTTEEREFGWSEYLPDDVEVAYCLWTTNSDPTLYWKRAGVTGFARLHHDDPAIDFLGLHEQSVLARLFVRLVEKMKWKDEKRDRQDLADAAKLTGFRHLDRVLELYLRSGKDPEYQAKVERLLAEIDEPLSPQHVRQPRDVQA